MENGSAYEGVDTWKGAFWPGLPETAVVAGKTRHPLAGLVLTIATLGVYHFYFHLAAHGELLQQLGRRNREAPFVFAYLGLVVYGVTLGWTLFFLPLVAAAGLFVYLVLQQFAVLEEARERQGLPVRGATGGPAKFFLWLIPGMLIVVGPYVAYKRLLQEYNEVWTATEKEAEPTPWVRYEGEAAKEKRWVPSMPPRGPAGDNADKVTARPTLGEAPAPGDNEAPAVTVESTLNGNGKTRPRTKPHPRRRGGFSVTDR